MSAGYPCPRGCGRVYMDEEKLADHLVGCDARRITEVPVPPWLRAKVDQLRAKLRSNIPFGLPFRIAFRGTDVVFLMLTEPPEGSSKKQVERWEYCCDNCGVYCPNPTPFSTGQLIETWDGVRFMVGYGACRGCLPLPKEES